MATRKIILFSDGTGNSSASLFKTNVWRMYQALDLARPDQLAYYDDGVGTSSFKPLAVLGGVFGYGLARNVKDIYAFLCRHHQDGAEIYGFGFSRGAQTMRVLSGMIASQGIITSFRDEADLQRKIARAYRDYRRRFEVDSALKIVGRGLRGIRDMALGLYDRAFGCEPYDGPEASGKSIKGVGNLPVKIKFLGLWDTVDAYGLPIDEMTKAWDDYIWRLSMRDRNLRSIVERARHALALDDERNTFHPQLWYEDGSEAGKPPNDRRLLQVWFSGVHSNVGGGYPIDGLSHVSLVWMIDQIDLAVQKSFGLTFIAERVDQYRKTADPLGPIYDSRQGLGGYYRYQPRRFPLLAREPAPSLRGALTEIKAQTNRLLAQGGGVPAAAHPAGGGTEITSPIIHHSVFERIAAKIANYSPVIMPPGAQVLLANGTLAKSADAHCKPLKLRDHQARAAHQDQVDNWIWLRRVTYFATLFTTLAFAAMPFYKDIENTGGIDRTKVSLVSEVPQFLAGFFPSFLKPWVDVYAANPGHFAGFGAAILLLNWLGSVLRAGINTRAGTMWRTGNPALHLGLYPVWLDRRIAAIRKSPPYTGFFRWFKGNGAPFFFFLVFASAGVAIVAQLAFSTLQTPPVFAADASPAVPPHCAAVAEPRALVGEAAQPADREFDTRCKYWPSGLKLVGGQRYELRMEARTRPREGEVFATDSIYSCSLGAEWLRGKPSPVADPVSWWDAENRADVFGFSPDWSDRSWWSRVRSNIKYALALPLRRDITQPWFTSFVRVGHTGRDEQPLRPKVPPYKDKAGRILLISEFTARANGEMYLFVNDAIDLPCLDFYRNNHGRAMITVRALGWDTSFNK